MFGWEMYQLWELEEVNFKVCVCDVVGSGNTIWYTLRKLRLLAVLLTRGNFVIFSFLRPRNWDTWRSISTDVLFSILFPSCFLSYVVMAIIDGEFFILFKIGNLHASWQMENLEQPAANYAGISLSVIPLDFIYYSFYNNNNNIILII